MAVYHSEDRVRWLLIEGKFNEIVNVIHNIFKSKCQSNLCGIVTRVIGGFTKIFNA